MDAKGKSHSLSIGRRLMPSSGLFKAGDYDVGIINLTSRMWMYQTTSSVSITKKSSKNVDWLLTFYLITSILNKYLLLFYLLSNINRFRPIITGYQKVGFSSYIIILSKIIYKHYYINSTYSFVLKCFYWKLHNFS